jgi:hypothetical protein
MSSQKNLPQKGMRNLFLRKIAFALIALSLAGCTPYQKMGLRGGVDDLQVSDVTYRITAKGNGYTSSERGAGFRATPCHEFLGR